MAVAGRAKGGEVTVRDVPAASGSARYLLEGDGARTSRLGQDGVGLCNFSALLSTFAHAARRQVLDAARRAGSASADEAMSRDMVAWIKAAKAHCAYVVLLNFVDAVTEAKARVSAPTAAVMDRLVALHALATMDDHMGDFMEDGHVTAAQAGAVRGEVVALLAELRPDAAALVDAFALDDYFLNSALGASDGDVYARLYDEVQSAPFNASHVPPGYAELLHSKLIKGAGRSKL